VVGGWNPPDEPRTVCFARMDWWWAYLSVGVFVGFFSGLLGIGGGALMVPLLAFIFDAKGFPPHVVHLALGTCVAAMLFTAASSALSHHRHRAVNRRVLVRMVPGILVGTLAGAALASRLDARLLTIAFTVLIFWAATLMVIEVQPRPARALPGAAGMAAVSGAIGLFSSLTATGGSAMVVAYLVRRGVSVHEAIGTASAVSWSLALFGTIGYLAAGATVAGLPPWSIGFVYLPALALIVATSMLMAPVGAAVAHRTPGRTLKRVFAVVLFALATGMLVRFF
jgi:uncharacterized protein